MRLVSPTSGSAARARTPRSRARRRDDNSCFDQCPRLCGRVPRFAGAPNVEGMSVNTRRGSSLIASATRGTTYQSRETDHSPSRALSSREAREGGSPERSAASRVGAFSSRRERVLRQDPHPGLRRPSPRSRGGISKRGASQREGINSPRSARSTLNRLRCSRTASSMRLRTERWRACSAHATCGYSRQCCETRRFSEMRAVTQIVAN